MQGKIALITGAANGQGKAEAQLLASLGARVFVADIDEAAGKAVSDDIGYDMVIPEIAL
ncbi:SDR family NAD(P)-dependent oxidoreductase [Paracoccus siganidrum]|uniref:SDR family NAD(P)-dependent oxidoreductase n=1 Tax=Paracoccus siganidrum TaxID=1276757 RepID=A0A418ZUK2_9RHOB|nr:SDR family NAD(P)-dependent oxidoreductase [Paracoccus siganidrum]RJL01220.1 SDR family NAD(P)-dependent oxidoreductase [Paracoccus siganidrum]RMC26976.1 hypothetical protein C9E82_22240 [Paracoccus siganidrum]